MNAKRLRSSIRMRYGIAELIATTILVLIAFLVLIPIFIPWLFVFKTHLEYSYNPWSFPKSFYTKNFTDAWEAVKLGSGFINTLIVCLGTILCTIPSTALAGYVFAKYRSRVTEFFFYAVLVGYFIPLQMVLIPLFKMSVTFKFVDTLHGLFLPLAAFAIPFWTLIYRSFFKSLPNDLMEAARIDGASHPGIFFRVMLPLAAPATVLATLLVFIGAWSDYMLSLIMLNDQKLFTMQLRVSQFLNAYGMGRVPLYASAAVISAAPTVILYIIGHRWIIKGTLGGALKE